MKIAIKNVTTGEIKNIKVGFSWSLFLFSGFLGLPLFLRRLNTWGAIFLVLWIVNIMTPSMIPGDKGTIMTIILFFIFLGLQTFVGVKGNEMTVKNYLENGWVFVEPDAESTKVAKMRWGILYNV